MTLAALVVNDGSRCGAGLASQAAQELEVYGVELGMSADVDGGDVQAKVTEALERGFSPVIIGGGDGTQALAAGVLKNTGVPMGILPLGTGNALARDLQIPVDLAGACRNIVTGVSSDIDVGEANGRLFVNLCSLGLTAGIDEALDPDVKSIIGRAAYVSAVAIALRQRTAFELTVRHSGKVELVTTLLAGCGPGNTQGGILPLPGPTSHHSGKISFYAVDSVDLVKYAELLFRLRQGTSDVMVDLVSVQADEIILETKPQQTVVVDGETNCHTPLVVRCLAGALRVIVPEKA